MCQQNKHKCFVLFNTFISISIDFVSFSALQSIHAFIRCKNVITAEDTLILVLAEYEVHPVPDGRYVSVDTRRSLQ